VPAILDEHYKYTEDRQTNLEAQRVRTQTQLSGPLVKATDLDELEAMQRTLSINLSLLGNAQQLFRAPARNSEPR
jgi:hypothetical protein